MGVILDAWHYALVAISAHPAAACWMGGIVGSIVTTSLVQWRVDPGRLEGYG